MLRVLFSAKFNFFDRLGKQNINLIIETACLNFDYFDFYDYYDTRLEFIKWNLSGRKRCVRASAKRRTKSNPITFNPQVRNKDVLYNPINPVNPDSKPQLQAP